MLLRLLVAALLIAFILALSWPALARDDGRHAQSPYKEWFDSLFSENGPCCSNADGVKLDDPEWEADADGYRVRINGQWLRVPSNAIVKATNRVGYAIVWPMYDGETIYIRCFMPGASA